MGGRSTFDNTDPTEVGAGRRRTIGPLQPWRLHGWNRGWGIADENVPGGKFALLDINGTVIGGRYFDWVELPNEGDVAVVVIDGRRVGLDHAGNIVPHPRNGRVFAS